MLITQETKRIKCYVYSRRELYAPDMLRAYDNPLFTLTDKINL